ncbi:MAG: hypothetical protein JWO98_5144 [Frankiales bacterium]|nr:hypothetical protein [Frankiales bacterium]
MVVSVVRDGEVAISTSLARYLQLNERELRWLVEVAGPRALAAFAEAGR